MSKKKILIVDDSPENIQILIATLKHDYTVIAAINGEMALEMVSKEPIPDLVLLDIRMDGLSGYDVLSAIRSNPLTKDVLVIFVTSLDENMDEAVGLSMGANDYITKPIRSELVKSRIKTHLDLMELRKKPENLFDNNHNGFNLIQEVFIETLATMADYRDPETGGHIVRTQKYFKMLIMQLKANPDYDRFMNKDYIDMCLKACPLHDLGKIGIDDQILKKPGRLTPEEFSKIQLHSVIGYNNLKRLESKLRGESFIKYACEIALTHHERWDGSGYPLGLKEHNIPLTGRIMALADAYDAIVSKRVYKEAIPHAEAVRIIESERGKHFDPEIVDAFLKIQGKFEEISKQNFILENDDSDIKLPKDFIINAI